MFVRVRLIASCPLTTLILSRLVVPRIIGVRVSMPQSPVTDSPAPVVKPRNSANINHKAIYIVGEL